MSINVKNKNVSTSAFTIAERLVIGQLKVDVGHVKYKSKKRSQSSSQLSIAWQYLVHLFTKTEFIAS